MTAAEIRSVIVDEIDSLLLEADQPVRPLADQDVLLETGLDSLAFAVLIVRLEDRLGYDPFTDLAEPVYPQTLGELCQVYALAPQPR
ncbi:MAG TPA: acyl carrier protein [Gaiellaceae bacterium]|nr:acyl carrier protein [Gaiellaceae bacterium]